ncbi:MAG: alkaline shock response membrane anchor protein AmaP, partial [Clostridiales bacterium]|nr:alkaline shock response membrane anchor protein AmaP [Clostridiales bacterium]
MKMLKKVLLFCWGLLALVVGGILICCTVSATVRVAWGGILNDLFASSKFWVFGLIVGILVLALAALSLYISLGNRKPTPYAKVFLGEDGQIDVSLAAIDSVVKKVAMQIAGIKDVKTLIKSELSGVIVMLDIILFPDCNIPETVTVL